MEWIDALAEWVIFPLLIIYGITSWAKDHPKKKTDDPFPVDPSENGNDSSTKTIDN
ncbi:MAG: hypothetical protein IKZ24_02690 [Burkholderiaceae bacterium]|nr:hypothetical protein [Burkholderiaceae bacterium]